MVETNITHKTQEQVQMGERKRENCMQMQNEEENNQTRAQKISYKEDK